MLVYINLSQGDPLHSLCHISALIAESIHPFASPRIDTLNTRSSLSSAVSRAEHVACLCPLICLTVQEYEWKWEYANVKTCLGRNRLAEICWFEKIWFWCNYSSVRTVYIWPIIYLYSCYCTHCTVYFCSYCICLNVSISNWLFYLLPRHICALLCIAFCTSGHMVNCISKYFYSLHWQEAICNKKTEGLIHENNH